MKETQIRDIIKKIFVMFAFSVIPLIFCCGCGGDTFGCKMDFRDCIQSSEIDGNFLSYNSEVDKDTHTSGEVSAFNIKGCNGVFGCDIMGSCVWNKYISCFNASVTEYESSTMDNTRNPLTEVHAIGCLNAYQICSGACSYDKYFDACYVYSRNREYSENNDYAIACTGCKNINLFAGWIDGCACVSCVSDDSDVSATNLVNEIVNGVFKYGD